MVYEEGYEKLLTYKQGLEIYRRTKRFTAAHLERIRDSRLIGHMNDSARSISSNIAEGAKRGDTKAYLFFLGVSRGSLEELKGDFEELKRELKDGERWREKDLEGKNKDREGKVGIEKEIEGLLDLIYGEDCMLGRQIRAVETKAIAGKALPGSDMIRKVGRARRSSEDRFWKLAEDRFGIEKDEKGIIRKKKDV